LKQVTLKKTNEKVSEMALGTMYFNTLVDREVSKQLLDTYYNLGGNFIDTANMYVSWIDGFEGGECESLIGNWMKDKRNRHDIFLSSKVGQEMKGVSPGLKKELIIKECENSLRRLKTDTIDLYFAHYEDPDTPIEETLEAFDTLKRQGKIRYTGVSNFRSHNVAEAQKAAECNNLTKFTFAQYRYTYLRPKLGTPFKMEGDMRMHATEDMLDYIREQDMNFMSYQTLMSGAYSRQDKEIPNEYIGPDSDERMKVLEEITEEKDANINHVVLAWAMQNEMKSIPLITGSKVSQIEDNVRSSEVKLTNEQVQRLNNAGI